MRPEKSDRGGMTRALICALLLCVLGGIVLFGLFGCGKKGPEYKIDFGGDEQFYQGAKKSYREGEVPGTHTVVYDSEIDTITITHEAHSRQGLALGALTAAEWLAKAPAGVYGMTDVLNVK